MGLSTRGSHARTTRQTQPTMRNRLRLIARLPSLNTSALVLLAFLMAPSVGFSFHSFHEKLIDPTEVETVLSRSPRAINPQDCRAFKFRTVDGSCNNLNNPLWGKSATPYARFLPGNYRDGKGEIPTRRNGNPLPNAREMSVRMARDVPIENATLAHMFMIWGQFVGHDITNKPRAVARLANRTEVKCCETSPQQWPQNCLPVFFNFDPFYSRFNKSCMEFTRSTPFGGEGFFSNQREQTNGNTAFIDGSTVYGSTHTRSKLLRTFQLGQLKSTQQFRAKHLLPLSAADCGPENVKCFEAGDVRVNMFPALAAMHTLWVREHNRVVAILHQLNPHWDDERLYQETRLILGAMIQHITFNEYLPLVLGPILIDWWGLNIQNNGYYTGYNPSIDPRISNGFAAAAYRYGHSLVQPSFRRFNSDHTVASAPLLGEEFFNNSCFQKPFEVDRILLGLANDRPREMDAFFTEQLTNRLLDGGEGFGDDLVATSIQRGRDHGIPPYNAWREFCGLPKLRNFDDLRDMMSQEQIQALRDMYGHVDDIELYPAGIAEWHVLGGIIGPTFACIVAQQFHNLRNGDRFWYENGDQPTTFTLDQLAEIRRTTLARVLCDNTDLVRTIQPQALKSVSRENRRVPCSAFRTLDLSWWRESNEAFR